MIEFRCVELFSVQFSVSLYEMLRRAQNACHITEMAAGCIYGELIFM